MKKSLIGLGVVAAMAVGGAANAGYFNIQGGQAPIGDDTFSGLIQTGTNASIGALDVSALTGSGLNSAGISQVEANGVATAMGISANGTLAYFGVKDGDKGYFGVMFIGNGSNFLLGINNASPPGKGVYSSSGVGGFGSETLSGGTYTWNNGAPTVNGQVYLWLFTELDHQASIGGNGNAFDSDLTVKYMTFSGGAWSSANTAGPAGISSSALNIATFIVPVPAPALLAGLGLAGALALRRRMK